MSEWLLNGLGGANLLGYLAALGTLRTVSLGNPGGNTRMDWTQVDGIWRPRLCTNEAFDRTAFIDTLATHLKESKGLAALHLADDLTMKTSDYRRALINAQAGARPDERRDVDFLSAFGSEAVETRYNGKPTGQIADTALRTMSGAGHQHFLATMRTFVADTGPEQLDKALFDTWRYDDPLQNHSMRWDPADDNRYALRWANPSGDRERNINGSMWGANRLAIEALPLFPCLPVGRRLETTGFRNTRGQPTRFTYPIWEGPLDMDSVASLVSLQALQDETPDRRLLATLGVVEVFRCERITQGKYRNFTPSRPV